MLAGNHHIEIPIPVDVRQSDAIRAHLGCVELDRLKRSPFPSPILTNPMGSQVDVF
jgi:hypothetical protein